MAKLRVRAVPGKLYPHLGDQESGRKRFLGHKFKLVEKGPAPDGSKDRYGFEHQPDEVHEFDLDTLKPDHRREYAVAVADGDLLADDAETAALCQQFTGRPCASAAPKSEPKPDHVHASDTDAV